KEAVDGVHEARLPTARGAHEGYELTIADLEVDAVDGQEGAARTRHPVVHSHPRGLQLDLTVRAHRMIQDHRSRVRRFSSGSGPIAGGNSSFHSHGRVASMTTRELNPFSPGRIAGSRGPLQARLMMSNERSGSLRVQRAQITSSRSETSMSSSTTTVTRPM